MMQGNITRAWCTGQNVWWACGGATMRPDHLSGCRMVPWLLPFVFTVLRPCSFPSSAFAPFGYRLQPLRLQALCTRAMCNPSCPARASGFYRAGNDAPARAIESADDGGTLRAPARDTRDGAAGIARGFLRVGTVGYFGVRMRHYGRMRRQRT